MKTKAMSFGAWGAALGLVALLLGCRGAEQKSEPAAGSAEPGKAAGPIALNGAGATFPFPLYSKWMSEYNKQKPNVLINYQSIGSGGGIRQVIAKTVDFGASDAPMTADEESKAPAKLLHLPVTLGAVAVAFNVPGLTELNLTEANVAGIYLGTIKKWNDAKLVADNPGAKLPDTTIVVAYRSDGSGTTSVFTNYLAKVSPEWKEKVGEGKSVKFPVGLGAKGNEGVTGQVKTTPGAVGYVELAYALQNNLATAAIRNASQKFVKASIPAVTAAAAGVELPDTLYASITNATGEGAYPISSYSYLLVYEETADLTKGKALAEFLWWAVHDGQKLAEPLHYATLPASVATRVAARLKTLRSGGKPLLSES